MLDEPVIPSEEAIRHGTRAWPHAPPHRLAEVGVYFVTARAAGQRQLLGTPQRRDWFVETLFQLATKYGWQLEAWAVLSNHYHLVGHSPEDGAPSLGRFLRHLHGATTQEVNRQDHQPGRTRLWHNYRETHLTLPRGYLARLHYTHENAAHHGLVANGWQWKWCSAAAFEKGVAPAWAQTVHSFRYDQIATADGE